MRTLLLALLLALPVLAQTPKAKSVEKEGEWDVVTLESGAFAKISVPKSIKKGEQPGMVLTLHGAGGEPNQMLGYGRELAEHRGDIWVAPRGSAPTGPGFTWETAKDGKFVPEIVRYVIATYGVDPKRVVVHGFSAGGAFSCMLAPANRDLFAGIIPCAAPDIPGGRAGGDVKGLRAVVFLGSTDANFTLAPQARQAVEKLAPNVAFREITGLGHQLPDIIYLNDAINFILDATEKGDVKVLPLKAAHAMAAPKGRQGPPPAYYHIYVAWKTAKAPAGVTRNKLQAKSAADGKLSKLRKGTLTREEAVKESDDAESVEAGGAIDLDRMKGFGQKLQDKARAMKAETWELVETESGYHLVWRAKAPE
ncbi:MAG: peptidylprolyl isomerase [Candidatus Brocadiae bacterium]|nr:peptidylprolyl isomerase [Candidatus Brocadiia bacterium]